MELNFWESSQLYLALRWAVFPLQPGTKIPYAGSSGCKDATLDPEQIGWWADEKPGCNIAVATGEKSGIVVIDIDPRHSGVESAKRWKWPKAPLQRTQSGGWHLVFRWTPELRNSRSRLGPGVDVKTTGGYIVVAPSQIEGGGRYEWVRPPRGRELPTLPDDVMRKLTEKPRSPLPSKPAATIKDLEGVFAYVQLAKEGHRNNALFWSANRAFEAIQANDKLKREDVLSELVRAGRKVGLDDGEIAQATRMFQEG